MKRTSSTLNITIACLVSLILITQFSISNSASAEPKLVFLGRVASNEKHVLTTIVDDASKIFNQSLSLDLDEKTVVFVSASPEELAEAYVKNRKLRRSAIPEKIYRYQNLSVAEATYRALYINVGSKGYPSRSRTRRANLVFHELFHLLQYELVGKKSSKCCKSDRVPVVGPVWMFEGSAEYYARFLLERNGYEKMSGYLNYIGGKSRKSGLHSLKSLETRKGMDKIQESYELSAYAVHTLVTRAGISSIPAFYEHLGRGFSWKKAFEIAFNMRPEKFYSLMRDQ